jgi:protein-tyrosine-phosphatase
MVDWSPRGNKLNTVLFLCTGNYYRSRFAEELFNHHADRAGLNWIAQRRPYLTVRAACAQRAGSRRSGR